MRIGRLKAVELRELWKDEANGFSAWLEENIQELAEQLDLPLSNIEREKPVGPFSVDLVAEDSQGRRVVIENQLEPTDHDHLGKILVYLTNLEAKTAIWITSDPRPEHLRAIEWLNEVSPADVDFYLVQVSAYKIGSSEPAPHFTVVARPSQDTKKIGAAKKALTEVQILRLKFWEGLLAIAREKGLALHANCVPSKASYLHSNTENDLFRFYYEVPDKGVSYISLVLVGKKATNKKAFDRLFRKRSQIDGAFGQPLTWERRDSYTRSWIYHAVNEGGLRNTQSRWPQVQEELVDAMGRLSKAFRPYLDSLRA